MYSIEKIQFICAATILPGSVTVKNKFKFNYTSIEYLYEFCNK